MSTVPDPAVLESLKLAPERVAEIKAQLQTDLALQRIVLLRRHHQPGNVRRQRQRVPLRPPPRLLGARDLLPRQEGEVVRRRRAPPRAARRAAPDARRPDRAQPRGRARAPRRARGVRRAADRRVALGDREGRGPRPVQEGDGARGPAAAEERLRDQRRRRRRARRDARRAAGLRRADVAALVGAIS